MEKSDLEFLNSYVKFFRTISANKIIALTLAHNEEFLFISQPMMELLKQKNHQLEGKKLRDINKIAPYINEYRELFNQVIRLGNPLNALIAHDFNDTGIKSIKLLHKEPLFSPITGKVIAIIDEITDFIVNRESAGFIRFMNQYTVNASPEVDIEHNRNCSSINLTKRQKEILFLLSIGKAPKNIATFLSQIENKFLAQATVTAIINKHLYVKFAVSSTSQLIEKAILSGAVNHIPESFIRKPGVLMILN